MVNNFATIRNASFCKEENIPSLNIADWRGFIIDTCKEQGGRVVSIFGDRLPDGGFKFFAIVGIDSKSELRIASTSINGNSYPCLTNELMQCHLFERELHENFGVIPENHPWLKPVRVQEGYDYYRVAGAGVHEVAVGPVHAGVIEPGHFRFQCHGEKVFNLEIHLGYQKRGVEELIAKSAPSKRLVLAESIAGDSAIANALCYCHLTEAFAERQVTARARIIRAVALELERIANHVGDLGAIANDVGFLPSASYFGAIRASFLNMLMEMSGNRFGRALIRPGGTFFDITSGMRDSFRERIIKQLSYIEDTAELMFSNPAVVSRLTRTGVVTQEQAREIGMVGVAARASGLLRDVRCDYPSGMYRFKKIIAAKAATGDVFARARVRYVEIKRSVELVLELLNQVQQDKIFFPLEKTESSSLAVSIIEGWRGEIVHVARTDETGDIHQYKIVDPSFHNWTGLELALRDGQISDFPLCNKSFNLSYAGYDL